MIFKRELGRNWIYAGIRLLTLVAFSIAVLLLRPRDIVDLTAMRDVLIPAAVGIVGLLAVGLIAAIPAYRVYAPFIIMPADWALTGALVYYVAADADPFLILAITLVLIVSGILRLGPTIGLVQAVGVLLAALVGLLLVPQQSLDLLLADSRFMALVLILAIVTISAIVWYRAIDEENTVNRRKVRQEIEESRTRLENMRERVKAFAEMAANLNSTLNYDKILDSAMDISRLSIRHDPKHRIISMALMVDTDENLAIATSRGLPHTDLRTTFPGLQGIIAEAIELGVPVVHSGGENDAELHRLRAFANIRTTLAIPLRSNFETYGVLVFGSTMDNAINEDHIDTLAAIGMQTAISLQNAVLYSTLQEEKERIIQIEENGRKALVRDLHDIPTQTISAVAMQLSIVPMIAEREPENLKSEVERIREMALRASEEIRHVMFTLRPLALETQGLTAALKQLAEKMEKTYKQHMELEIDPRVEKSLVRDAQGTLFYLIEEAANNARKYAEASVIRVRVGIDADGIICTIRDNGKGFDMELVGTNYENRGSFGMVNMRERAELINGEFDLQSAPGRGTSVTVRVPAEIREPTRPIPNLAAKSDSQPRRPLRQSKKRREYTGPLSPRT